MTVSVHRPRRILSFQMPLCGLRIVQVPVQVEQQALPRFQIVLG
jgi:hypothetical protein